MKNEISYIKGEQKKVTEFVTKNFKKYYLTGGTALAFYFNHRFSEDLDFFSQKYNKDRAEAIMNFISQKTCFTYHFESEQTKPGLIPMRVYFLQLKGEQTLKVDFVQDFSRNIHSIKKGLH